MKPRLRFSALVWALGLVASPAAAQAPTLVKTINTTGTGSSSPGGFAVVGSTIFFAANDGVHGVELWKTDGTGTSMVLDIRPGSADSNPQNLLSVNGTTLFFTADDGVNGVELWKSDGTPGGTVMLKAANGGIRNGVNKGSDPSGLVEYTPGLVLFAADDGVFGRELWRSDGTDLGTTIVANIYAPTGASNPVFLTNFGGYVYFAADSPNLLNQSIGVELWRTDGTGPGTTLVADINPVGNGKVSDLTVAGGRLFFVANDGINGVELWQYDGLTASMLKPTAGGIRFSGDSNPAHLTALGSTLFFSARDDTGGHGIELWKSDGTDLGTVLVADINPLTANSNPANLTAAGGLLFFTADDGTHGIELWKTDGIATGIVQDIVPGAASSNPQYLVNAAGTLFFSAAGPGGVELWKSTGSGATQIPDINPFGSSLPTGLTAAGSTVYFSADNGTLGAELWKSNATTATLVADINLTHGAAISGAVRMGDDVFFSANDGTTGAELWKSDGSLAGTVLVKDINTSPATGDSSFPSNLAVVSLTAGTDTLFFAATDGSSHGNELWRSDGTVGSATMVRDINSGPAPSDPHGLVDVNGTLFFAATDASGTELWKSDGTLGGTVLVKDISPGATSSNPQFLTNVNGTLYFAANDGVQGNELWKSDGTAAGTVLVKDIKAGNGSSNPASLTNLNGTLVFTADENIYGNDLWKSDGTALGTVPIDIRPGAGSSNPSSLTVMGNAVFLAASDGSTQALWKYDALGGAVSVKGLSSAAQSLTNVSGTLYFLEVKTAGTVLWRSDGTTGGTVALTTFTAAVSPAAGNLTGVFGTLYFAADDGANGLELWKSNATGTFLVANIFTGAGPSSPAQLTTMPGGLLFTATDSVQGRQLWGIVTADVGVDQIATPSPVALDGVTNVTLTGTVTNHGHVAAPGVLLTETLSSVNFVSGSWTSGANSGSCGGSPVTCAVGTLDAGAFATVTLTVTPTLVGSFPEKATVTTTSTDLNPTNDSATTTLAVWPQVSIADAMVEEGNLDTQNMDFVVTLAHPSANTVTIQYATVDGLAPTAATAPADYTTTTGTLTFLPGVTVGHIFVPIVGDTLPEPDEQLFVNLSAPAFAFISRAQGIGTIKDNDSYQIAIADAFIAEGDTGTSSMNFTVTLTGVLTNNTILIDYTTGPTAPVSATAGPAANPAPPPPADYATTTGTLTFPSNPGVSTTLRTISVPIVGDVWNEDNETFQVNLSINPLSPLKAPNVILTDAHGLGTIQDNDPPPNISISDVTVTEGNSGTTNAVFNVTLDNPSGRTVSVAYATAAGTANEGLTAVVPTDYLKRSGSLTFPSGTTTLTVTVPIVGDTVHEADETFFVNLTSPVNAVIAKIQGVGTIQDDDFQVSVDNVSVTEGDTPGATTDAVFTVTLNGTLRAANLQVKYATAPGSATAGTSTAAPADYVTQGGTLTFTPGGPLTQTITVPVVGDVLDEVDETFLVNLTKDPASPVPAGNVTLVDPQGTGTILDDDPQPKLSINDVSQVEGNVGTTSFVFTVTLDAPSAKSVSVAYATAPGTATPGTTTAAPADYLTRSGTLTFAPGGALSQTIAVPVVGDTRDDLDPETFFVNLSSAVNADINKGQGLGSIIDDDISQISINNVTLAEGNPGSTSTAFFTVSLSPVPAQPVTVDYATGDGTATGAAGPGQDYVPTSGTLTFGAGQASATIPVTVNGDDLSEANETFVVNLTNQTNAVIAVAQGLGTITNDDALPTLSVDNVAVLEKTLVGPVTATFHITLSKVAGQTVTVKYATSNGTAVAPGDYTAINGTLTFPPGSTSQTVDVQVVSDALVENNEICYLSLSLPVGATLAKPQGQLAILDDDAGGREEFAAPTFTVGEAAPFAVVTVKRVGSVLGTVRVDYRTSDGSAIAGQDYSARAGTLTFGPGMLTRTLMVPILHDTVKEGDETFLVTLSNPTGGSVLGAQATAAVTIVDDDATVFSFLAAKYATKEGLPATKIIVRRTGVLTKAATVGFAVTGGTATLGSDYAVGVGGAGTLTFGPGIFFQTFDFVTTDDTVAAEVPETAIVSLTNPQSLDPSVGAKIGTPDTTTVTITDNEPTLQFAVTSVPVREAATTATATLFVRRSSAIGTATVDYTLGGTATPGPGGDYLPPAATSGGTLQFLPGMLQVAIPFTILPDDVGEAPETIQATLVNPTGASLGANKVATITITDNEPTVQFALATYTAGESSGTTNLVVRRSSSVGDVTVDYAVSGGTATNGLDYTGGTGTLTFTGTALTQSIPITLIPDLETEGNETVAVTLSNPTHATLGTPATTVLTITDDDAPALFFSAASYATTETAHFVAVTVKRSGPTTGAASVFYGLSAPPGTATDGVDYTGASGFLSFLPGQTFKSFYVTILNDTIPEPAETINLELSFPSGAVLGTQKTAVVTIADNDLPGTFSFSAPTYSIGEAGPTAKITVKRVGGMASNVAVHYATSNGTATAGQDYNDTSGELFFGANVTTMTFEVPIIDDAEDEADETLNLTLTPFATAGQSPAIIGLGSATLTIVDNDTIGAFSFATASFSASEGVGVAVITVTRSGAASGNTGPTSSVTVHYKTSANTATVDTDYLEAEGDLTFGPGVTTQTFTVPIIEDNVHEGNETVDLALSAPTGGATLGAQSAATLWIVDND